LFLDKRKRKLGSFQMVFNKSSNKIEYSQHVLKPTKMGAGSNSSKLSIVHEDTTKRGE
jgi:hypothetical protein